MECAGLAETIAPWTFVSDSAKAKNSEMVAVFESSPVAKKNKTLNLKGSLVNQENKTFKPEEIKADKRFIFAYRLIPMP